MSFNSNIIPGAAPLQWSNVYDAFTKINENFDILVATVGDGSGLTPIDFGTLDTNVSPTSTNVYKLGDGLHQWKAVHTAEWAETLGSETNGLWAGSAQIKGKGLIVDLPLGSTVDGDLIIDPDKTFFKSIQVNNDLSVEATEFGSAVNLLSGLGIDLSVSSGADSITIEVNPTFDLNGSVIAEDGNILVNNTTGFLTGNVGVASEWRVTANSNTWKFRDDGMLEWPSLASFGDSGSSGDLLSAGAGNNLTLASEIDIVMISDSDGGGATWVFSSVGELTVPGPIISEFGGAPTISLESSVTGGAIRGEAGKTFKVSLSDGVSSFPEWVFGADGILTLPNGGKFNNPYGDGAVNLSGNQNLYAALASYDTKTWIGAVDATYSAANFAAPGGGVFIQTDINASNNTWAFRADGSLSLPGALTLPSGGGDIRSEGNINIDINLADSTLRRWQFGEDGSLTLPIGVSIDNNADPSFPKIIADSNLLFSVQGQGEMGSAALAWTVDPNAASQYAAVSVNKGGSDNLAKIILMAMSDSADVGTAKVWKFDETGALTIPGDIRSEGAINIDINLSDSTLRRWQFSEDGITTFPSRIVSSEIEGIADELNIYSDWAKDTGVSIVSLSGTESVTLTSDRIVAVVTNVGLTQKQWIFEENGVLTLPAGGYIAGDTQGVHTGNIFTTLIDSADSSAITVTPKTIFSTDVDVGMDLVVTQNVTAAKFIGDGSLLTGISGTGGGLSSRTTVSGTTAFLSNGDTGNLTITGFKGYFLYKIQTSAAAWVRIYTDTASRGADVARSELTDPTPGSGVIAEVITTGAQTILISPGAMGFSNETSPSTNIELAVTNKSGGVTDITVTLTVLQIEA
jgi:hypothetical protein